MDSLIAAAAKALSKGQPLRTLNLVALRDDAAALALRGIAMAQLGDLDQAKLLLKRAVRAFGPKEPLARARCVVAHAEIAFVSRDLGWPPKQLAMARETLEAHGDFPNAAHAAHLQARRSLLLGRLEEAEQILGGVDLSRLPPARSAAHQVILAGLAMRRLHAKVAREAFTRAEEAARISGIQALQAEVRKNFLLLDAPAARKIHRGEERLINLTEVETLLASGAFVVDACRRVVRLGRVVVPLTSRPVLFSLARQLSESWPHDVPRDELIRSAFEARKIDDSHRARLRVEIGRLRKLLLALAEIRSTRQGYTLHPCRGAELNLLAWPLDEDHSSLLAFLADGEAWSSSALALALGVSQRTVQRALDLLAADGRVLSLGLGRARRWITPAPADFATTLLLPTPVPGR